MAGDALAGLGSSIAAFRRGARLTQQDLADRVGMSVQWVSGVEQGRLRADRLRELVDIASAVGCQVPDLLGRPVDALTNPGARAPVGGVGALRAVVLRAAIPTASVGPTPTPEEITRRVDAAWAIWHGSPTAHTTLSSSLPALLSDALACHHHAQGKREAGALAGVWQITREWLYHVPEGQGALAWIAAERALAAARESDDLHLIALGSWAVAGVYRQMDEQEESVRLCLAAADAITPRLDGLRPDPRLLSAYGSLHLTASLSAAASRGDGRAWALHQVAEQAATALGGSFFDARTAFGSTEVGCRAIAIHERLGNSDAVVENVPRLDLGALPSTHRRACVLIDLARAHARRGEDEAAARVLLDAERSSGDEIHQSPRVRDTVRDLLLRDRAGARPHVRGLARRIGLIAA
jgi:transcriptional regulator with XRE-family HTH domain